MWSGSRPEQAVKMAAGAKDEAVKMASDAKDEAVKMASEARAGAVKAAKKAEELAKDTFDHPPTMIDFKP